MPRHFLRFETAEHRRRFVGSQDRATVRHESRHDERLVIAELEQSRAEEHRAAGVQVFKDIHFVKTDGGAPAPGDQALPPNATLAQVVQQVRAPSAWGITRGQGVTVAILDTGVVDAPEFAQKHSPLSFSTDPTLNPWDSDDGHGVMCASIAAGTAAAGGRYDGVAPAAMVLSARAGGYDASDMYPMYDQLLQLRNSHALLGPVVLNNSYGMAVCQPPGDPPDHPFFQIIAAAGQAGMASVFAAGDWHATQLCHNSPSQCTPNTIWSANSLDAVLSVGAVDWNNSNQVLPHGNSSRGPGELAIAFPKPDCVAPTYGEVLRWHEYQSRPWWGTSASAPVVVGLLALVFSRSLQLGKQIPIPAAFDLVRQTCHRLPAAATCVGNGLVDCLTAVGAVQ